MRLRHLIVAIGCALSLIAGTAPTGSQAYAQSEQAEQCIVAVPKLQFRLVAPDSLEVLRCYLSSPVRIIVNARNIFGATIRGSFNVEADGRLSLYDDASRTLLRTW